MEHLSKVNHDFLLPKQFHTAAMSGLKILSLFLIFSSILSPFVVQKQEPIFCLPLCTIFFFIITIFFIFKAYLISSSETVYLVDFSCLKPPSYWRVPFSSFLEHSRIVHSLDQESIDFMSKVLTTSGQSQRTCIPPALHFIPPRSTHEEAIKEAQSVLFPVFEDLLSKTHLSPLEIDILIINCSGFCPSPSLSSIIVNKYSMREDIKSFNISGMGCSASALAIDMARNLLKTHKNSNAVILSTEILSNGWYAGKNRSMMILNCLFRTGSAAILITNKRSAKTISKYKLLYALRTQGAFDDRAYNSAVREEDSDGITGVTLRKDVLRVVGEILRSHILVLGSAILPLDEKLRYGFSILTKKFFNKRTEIHVPKFRKVIQHYCLPASGKAVIMEIGKGLKLEETEMEAALMTLHRFGNQSSSSLWYELGYIEAKEKMKTGEKVWQLGLGSGTKCVSLVWECIRPIIAEAQKGPWADCIDSYPVVGC